LGLLGTAPLISPKKKLGIFISNIWQGFPLSTKQFSGIFPREGTQNRQGIYFNFPLGLGAKVWVKSFNPPILFGSGGFLGFWGPHIPLLFTIFGPTWPLKGTPLVWVLSSRGVWGGVWVWGQRNGWGFPLGRNRTGLSPLRLGFYHRGGRLWDFFGPLVTHPVLGGLTQITDGFGPTDLAPGRGPPPVWKRTPELFAFFPFGGGFF